MRREHCLTGNGQHGNVYVVTVRSSGVAAVGCVLAMSCGGSTDGAPCGPGTRWDGARCVVDGTPDASMLTPDAPMLGGLRVFVSSLRYPANLQAAGGQATGLASADALCQGLADAASLGGRFRAWLSTSTVDAIDHIEGSGPWYRMDGVMAFPNHASLGTTPRVSIHIDEKGGSPNPFYEPWTGTAVGGRYAPPSGTITSTTCLDWTSTSNSSNIRGVVGYYGEEEAPGNGPAWTFLAYGYCTPFSRHLYCFEQ